MVHDTKVALETCAVNDRQDFADDGSFGNRKASKLANSMLPAKDMEATPELVRVDSNCERSSVSASTVNVFKAIVGSGVLSLSQGVAGFSDSNVSLVPGIALCLILGFASAYSFWSLGRLALVTCRETYGGLLEHAYGSRVRLPMDIILVLQTCLSSLMYQIVIGDLSRDLGALLGLHGIFGDRSFLLGALSMGLLLPLGLLRSFAALAPIAALGSVALLYICVFMAIRFFQGAYAPGGLYYAESPFQPSFNQQDMNGKNLMVLVAMFGTSYICHYNAPKFVEQLDNPTSKRFAIVSSQGFLLAFAVMTVVMVLGFSTFGGACQGLILNNYAVADGLAAAARGASLLSCVTAYPFALVAFRDGLLQLLARARGIVGWWEPSLTLKRISTVFIVASLTGAAMLIDDLGFVAAFVGAVFASLIIYIIPALAMLGTKELQDHHWERLLNKVLLVLGLVVMFIGAWVTLTANLGVEDVKEGIADGKPTLGIPTESPNGQPEDFDIYKAVA